MKLDCIINALNEAAIFIDHDQIHGKELRFITHINNLSNKLAIMRCDTCIHKTKTSELKGVYCKLLNQWHSYDFYCSYYEEEL